MHGESTPGCPAIRHPQPTQATCIAVHRRLRLHIDAYTCAAASIRYAAYYAPRYPITTPLDDPYGTLALDYALTSISPSQVLNSPPSSGSMVCDFCEYASASPSNMNSSTGGQRFAPYNTPLCSVSGSLISYRSSSSHHGCPPLFGWTVVARSAYRVFLGSPMRISVDPPVRPCSLLLPVLYEYPLPNARDVADGRPGHPSPR